MARKRLFLFDIDGTLMLSGGAGARSLVRTFRELFGLENPLEGVRLGGQTDPQIFADVLERAGLTAATTPADLDRTRERYLKYLAEEIVASEKAEVLPGVPALVERLAGHPEVKLALVTGNFEPGARIKLSRFDLNRYFPLGGFGSDSRLRRELVPIAMDRARAHYGLAFDPADTIVIGDTEKDVDCGRHSGTKTVAVCTGSIGEADLKACNPDLYFPSFAETDRVVEALLAL